MKNANKKVIETRIIDNNTNKYFIAINISNNFDANVL